MILSPWLCVCSTEASWTEETERESDGREREIERGSTDKNEVLDGTLLAFPSSNGFSLSKRHYFGEREREPVIRTSLSRITF